MNTTHPFNKNSILYDKIQKDNCQKKKKNMQHIPVFKNQDLIKIIVCTVIMIISGAYIILNSADIAHNVHCNVANMDEIWFFILPRLISFKSFCCHLHSIRCGLKRFNSHYRYFLLKWQFSEYFVNALKKKLIKNIFRTVVKI